MCQIPQSDKMAGEIQIYLPAAFSSIHAVLRTRILFIGCKWLKPRFWDAALIAGAKYEGAEQRGCGSAGAAMPVKIYGKSGVSCQRQI